MHLASRHAEVDADTFYRIGRERMNSAVDGPGHHPKDGYSPLAHRHYTRRLALLDRLKTVEFATALDVGCAEGFFAESIATARSAEVWGVDLSDSAVAVARSRRGLTVAAAEATALPFADGAFDLVYSTEVIEHVLDPAAMLAEMRRVSRRHVLVTTPVSQTTHEHEPDYQNRLNGHINDFDEATMRRLFGPDADLQTFRCNATFALISAFGRNLPPGPRDFFYTLDRRVAKRFGSPHRRFVPLRNRDWIILTTGTGQPGPREWRCPRCHGELEAGGDGLRCVAEDVTFGYAASGVPDFLSPL